MCTMCRYDFHRGVDIPTPEGTPVHAIDGGSVRIAGSNPHYTDLLVQVYRSLPNMCLTIDSATVS